MLNAACTDISHPLIVRWALAMHMHKCMLICNQNDLRLLGQSCITLLLTHHQNPDHGDTNKLFTSIEQHWQRVLACICPCSAVLRHNISSASRKTDGTMHVKHIKQVAQGKQNANLLKP